MTVTVVAAGVLLASVVDQVGTSATTVVIVGAAVTVLAQCWRKVIRPVVRGAEALAELLRTTDRRLTMLEETVKKLTSIVDLAHDENVADMRALVRRGEVPHPLLGEEPPAGDAPNTTAGGW